MKVDIQTEHRWLEQFSGNWEMVFDADTPADQRTDDWVETGRTLHGVWAVVEGRGEMPGGGKATTILTLGYDPARKAFIGTWIGSMMAHLWVYEGQLTDDGRLVLNSEGPDFETGAMRSYQDIYAFEGSDIRTLTSQMLMSDGHWHVFMNGRYKRVG